MTDDLATEGDACDARIRPFPDDREIACGHLGSHEMHQGVLVDYAYPGSRTVVSWHEDDRRNFHGDWPGPCPGCVFPVGHGGRHHDGRDES